MRLTTVVVFLCAASASAWASGYGKLQLSFEANQGQTDARVQFLSRGHAQTLFLTSTEAVLRTGHDVFRMKLAGANPASKAEGAELRAGKSNYFIGNDPAKWRTGVAQYGRVRFAEVYRGIDLVYYGADGQLEYDWIVKPGADASKIRLQFDGVEKMRVDANGDLVLETASGEIREKKPVVYQAREIAGRYVIRGREAAFEVGPYDRGKQLVIDPVLAYSSYLGGSGNDWGTGIAVDSAGNAYVTGLTESTDFPLSHAFQSTNPPSTDESETSDDAFVAKVSADGSTLIYSTYIGGTGADSANAIAVDASGDAYITGTTESTDFPLSNAFQSKNLGVFGNSFVTKLNPAGSALLFSTYLGGDQSDVGYGIAVDTAGNAYITGNTNSDNFPLVNAIEGKTSADTFPSAFLTKMSADGSTLLYSTYLGGYKGQDIGYGVAVDSSGSAYVAGTTSAPDLPVVNALQAASKNSSDTGFVMKINPGGSAIVYSTYLGGSVIDHLYALAVDSSGNAYVTGSTNSTDFPTVNALEAERRSGRVCQQDQCNGVGAGVVDVPGKRIDRLGDSGEFGGRSVGHGFDAADWFPGGESVDDYKPERDFRQPIQRRWKVVAVLVGVLDWQRVAGRNRGGLVGSRLCDGRGERQRHFHGDRVSAELRRRPGRRLRAEDRRRPGGTEHIGSVERGEFSTGHRARIVGHHSGQQSIVEDGRVDRG